MPPFEKRITVGGSQSYYEFLGAFRDACNRSHGVFTEDTGGLRPEYTCIYADDEGRVIGEVKLRPVDIDDGEFELIASYVNSKKEDSIKDVLDVQHSAFISRPAYCKIESTDTGTMHIRCDNPDETAQLDIMAVPGEDGIYFDVFTSSKSRGLNMMASMKRLTYPEKRGPGH